MRILISCLVIAFFFSGCTSFEVAVDMAKRFGRSDGEARYKVGDPYEVRGVWYYPERDLSYDETGIASWYGKEFAGKPTANGERFDPAVVSAAHKTLPMPSAVRVTNLENGRAMVVRVNDRGPFVAGRIIDLSREAARLLGFQKKGIARVRVQVLAEESLRLEREAKEGRFPSIGAASSDAPRPKTTAAEVPSVSLKSRDKSGSVIERDGDAVSAIDLITSSRSTDVIELEPVATSIWVQAGAFANRSNAEAVAQRLQVIGSVEISSFDLNGSVVHRVRIGPLGEVGDADRTLARVLELGYQGSRIILE